MLRILVLILLVVPGCSIAQKMVLREDYTSIVDIDNNNWNYGRRFKKGDTVTYVRHSKAEKDYIVAASTEGQQFYFFRTSLYDLDNYVAKKLEEERLALEAMHSQGRFVLSSTTTLKAENVEHEFKIGDTVTILDARPSGGWATLSITKRDAKATILSQFVKITPTLQGSIDKMLEKYYQEMEKKQAKLQKELQIKRAKEMRAKYGQEIANRIINGEIWIGMTDKMTLDSIGPPGKVNRTVDASGTFDQWVYSDRYLYFQNGKLKSWQESF